MKRIVAAVLVAAAGLAGCAQSKATTWVKNTSEGLFVQVPSDWARYKIDPYEVDTVRPIPPKRTTGRWQTVFDATPGVSKAKARQHLEADLPPNLVGSLSTQSLPLPQPYGSTGLREGLSIALMRQFSFFEFGGAPQPDPATEDPAVVDENTGTNDFTKASNGIDPVEAFDNGNPSIEMLSYEEYPANSSFPGAPELRGLHIRFNWEVYDNRWVTVDQKILTDPKTDKVYRLILKCESSCFKKNANLANRITNSFTIKK